MVLPVTGVTASSSIGSIRDVSSAATEVGTSGFADKMTGAMQSVSNSITEADAAVQDVAAGGDTPIHEMMVAQTKAQLSTELMVQMRNKAVESYQEIMRMQV